MEKEHYKFSTEEKFIVETMDQYINFGRSSVTLDGTFSIYDLQRIIKLQEKVINTWID